MEKHIAHYLKGFATLKITMKPARDDGEAPRLDAFSEDEYAGDKADRKSMTGGVLRLNGTPLRWGARKHGGVSLSTMRLWPPLSDARRASDAGGSRACASAPMQLHLDNQAAMR